MITKNALYDFVQSVIYGSGTNDACVDAETFRNLRSSVNAATKVIRVEVTDGQHTVTHEDYRKELGVGAIIQCWVTPEADKDDPDFEMYLDEATDLSFEMSRQIFEAIAANPTLDGRVCDCLFNEFETGEASMGGNRIGTTYLDGVINQAS